MRLRIVQIHDVMLLSLLKAGETHVKILDYPLPDDAELARVGYDHTGKLYLVVESKEFQDLADGEMIPEHPRTTFERLPCQPAVDVRVP